MKFQNFLNIFKDFFSNFQKQHLQWTQRTRLPTDTLGSLRRVVLRQMFVVEEHTDGEVQTIEFNVLVKPSTVIGDGDAKKKIFFRISF